MGNDTSSVQAAPEDSQLPSATKANANTPAGACRTCSPHIAKKPIAGGKGSWEFRFFALVSPGGEGGSDGSGTLDDALSRAHGVTGVDLSSKSKMPGWYAEDRSDIYLVCNEKGGKKIGVKARGKEGGVIEASDIVEVKQCTRRDGSGGERLNKQALSFSSLGWPSASGHHAAVLVRKIRSSSSRCELVLCRVCDDAVAGAQDGREEVWLSVCCEASGLLRKRADVCRRGLELLRLWRSAFPEARVVVGSYARWLVMRRKQKFHSAEHLDALSVLPKDAELLRRQARCPAKHAD